MSEENPRSRTGRSRRQTTARQSTLVELADAVSSVRLDVCIGRPCRCLRANEGMDKEIATLCGLVSRREEPAASIQEQVVGQKWVLCDPPDS